MNEPIKISEMTASQRRVLLKILGIIEGDEYVNENEEFEQQEYYDNVIKPQIKDL